MKKQGCYKDNQKPPRPSNYILTDRDRSLKIYSGKDIDWEGWINYLSDLVCRCAQLAESKNFTFFGIQFFGRLCISVRDKLLQNLALNIIICYTDKAFAYNPV